MWAAEGKAANIIKIINLVIISALRIKEKRRKNI